MLKVFIFRGKRKGNKFTFISIIMILVVMYAVKLASPQKEAAYPDSIRYDNLRYVYIETVKSSPVMFVRKRPASEEGYIILARRGISVSEEIYIYEGYRKYRRYVVLNSGTEK